ncbi:MAG: mechanosensitive ion channel, partial [Allosphingosinicella sp.]
FEGTATTPGATASATPAGAAPEVSTAGGKTSISRSIGLLVFFLIMIPVTIAALDALKIEAISGPATQMLRTILDSIPLVLGALILLAIGYVIGKLAKQAVEQILPSLGFDRSVSAIGISPEGTTPSRTVGTIVMVAIVIFFAIKAAELLQSPIIAAMLAQILELGSRVLFGAVIILGGVLIAKIASNLVTGDGTGGWLPAILKWSIIALAVAMGLRFMGLANEIVIIAFAAIIGSAAVACALAFGLGGRPTAHKLLERWTESNAPPAPPSRPRAPRPPSDDQPPLV